MLVRVTVCRQHLQRSRTVGRLGLLRRVQPHFSRGAVRRRGPSQVHPGRHQGQEEDVQLHRRGDQADSKRWTLYHNESWIRRTRRTARELEGTL